MECVLQYTSVSANGCIPSPVDKTSDIWWWDRGYQEANEWAKAGITDVLTLPPTQGQNLGNGYDPRVEYSLNSRAGNRKQLQRFAAGCKRNGQGFHVDAVMAHMDGTDAHKAIKITLPNGQALRFPKDATCFVGPGVPKDSVLVPSEDFAHLFGPQLSYFSSYYDGGARGYVLRGRLAWMFWLLDALDAQGIRIDNAKSMDPWIFKLALDKRQFWSAGEAWTSDTGVMNRWCFSSGINGRGSLFDFPRFFEIRDMCNNTANYDMRKLVNTGFAQQAPMNAMTFVNSQDVETSGNRIKNNILLGYALNAFDVGLPCIYYPDWNDYGEGNKADLRNQLWIRRTLAQGTKFNRESSFNTYAYERKPDNGPGMLAVFNNDSWGDTKWRYLQTAFHPFTWLKSYTGHGPMVQVDYSGRGWFPYPKNNNGLGYDAYSVEGMDGPIEVRGGSTIQRFEGAIDLYEPAATPTTSEVNTILCDAGTKIILYPAASAKGLTFGMLNTNGLPMDFTEDHEVHVAARGTYTITVTAPATVKTQNYAVSVRYTAPVAPLASEIN